MCTYMYICVHTYIYIYITCIYSLYKHISPLPQLPGLRGPIPNGATVSLPSAMQTLTFDSACFAALLLYYYYCYHYYYSTLAPFWLEV